MEFRRQKTIARLALLVFVAVCGTWLARLDYTRKISTNVLDLMPASEQAPELNLVRSFASDVQARVMLFALRDASAPDQPPLAAAQKFAAELAAAPEFAEALALADSGAQQQVGRAVFEQRFALLLPTWLAEREREYQAVAEPRPAFARWLAERTAADLEAFLSQPEAAALQDLVPADPLLLVPRLAERARLASGPAGEVKGHALVWARIKASPLSEAGQQPVFAAVDRATAAAQAVTPHVDVRWTGVNRFAAASRARIEAELSTLNVLSIVGVLLVSAIFVSRITKVIHLAPVILLSLLGAWAISTAVFDRLHILVFVLGSLLSGVAIDYGVYIYMQPHVSPEETYGGKLRRLLKPLLASCLTTVIGFSLLMFSDLPLIKQIGFFVGAGLLCALGSAMLYFAQLERPFLAGRELAGLGTIGRRPWLRWAPRVLLGVAILVVLIGPWRLRWRDDVRELDSRSPELNANEDAVRGLFGDTSGRTLFLTYGDTVAEARTRLEVFQRHLANVAPEVSTSSLGALLPTPDDWSALPRRLEPLHGFADELATALGRHGFSPESFDPFFAAWREAVARPPSGSYDELAGRVTSLLSGPLAMLSSTHAPYWFLTIADGAVAAPVPNELRTIGVNQLQSLNDLFMRYRWSALRLSLAGLGLVIASVFAIYPFKRGLRIALIPAGSCFFVFGVFGLLGHTLNLFNLLGAFLGVCLSHNYAIFSAEAAGPGGAPPVSIRLSALSTATSFGVLSFSHIPVIHALGLTVALIVVTALVTVELEPLARRNRP